MRRLPDSVRFLLLALVLLGLLPDGAQAGGKAALVHHRFQVAEVNKIDPAVTSDGCENSVWAVALESVLAAQQVTLAQKYWVDKSGGGGCTDAPPALADVPAMVDGEYTLPTPDGAEKVLLKTQTSSAPLQNVETMVAELKAGRPAVLVWKGHAYVLVGIVYDESIYPNGQREFELRELRLIDTARALGSGRRATFVQSVDDGTQITGLVIISVTHCAANVMVCR